METFIIFVQGLANTAGTKYGYTPDLITTEEDKKFIRVVSNRNGRTDMRSVWGFVDKATGDIFKVASWKVPAKHARGSINDPGSWGQFTDHGPQYLK